MGSTQIPQQLLKLVEMCSDMLNPLVMGATGTLSSCPMTNPVLRLGIKGIQTAIIVFIEQKPCFIHAWQAARDRGAIYL